MQSTPSAVPIVDAQNQKKNAVEQKIKMSNYFFYQTHRGCDHPFPFGSRTTHTTGFICKKIVAGPRSESRGAQLLCKAYKAALISERTENFCKPPHNL